MARDMERTTSHQTIDSLRLTLATCIAAAYPEAEAVAAEVTIPTDKKKADYVSNVAFQLAKKVGVAPVLIAQTLAEHFNERELDYTAEAAAPGFINFRTSSAGVGAIVRTIIAEGDQFGKGDSLSGQTWVVEHTSPNPNKAMHVGHLRNNLLGMSIAHTLEFSGAKVVRDWIDNNRGIAIAKAMWGYLAFRRKAVIEPGAATYALLDEWYVSPDMWVTPEEAGEKSDQFVGDCYTEGSDAFKNDTTAEEATRRLALQWELGDPKVWKLWELVISYAHKGIFETLERIDNRWDNGWHEHEHYAQGKEFVQKGLESGVFTKLDDGAILTNLEGYKLPNTVVLKSDGTSLYITQDIALTKLKKETYNADKLIWIIGPEQSIAMKQVFAVCEQLGIGKLDDFIHIPYGLISVSKDGARKKMSSRGGEALLIDTLLDAVQEAVLEKDRGYTREEADRLAIAAVKFAMLKPSRNTDTVMDISQIVNLEGDTGVYVLYTMARMRALLSKQSFVGVSEGVNYNELEHQLVIGLSYFPNVVRSVLTDFSPSVLVEYALEVSKLFNAVYAKERFISDNDAETQKKLGIAAASVTVLESVTRLLGLPQVDKI